MLNCATFLATQSSLHYNYEEEEEEKNTSNSSPLRAFVYKDYIYQASKKHFLV